MHGANLSGMAGTSPAMTKGKTMSRNNVIYLIAGALAVAVGVLAYQLYQERKKPEGVQINVGPGGLSIEKK